MLCKREGQTVKICRLNISLKSKVVLIVSIIMLVITTITIIPCYNFFYNVVRQSSDNA